MNTTRRLDRSWSLVSVMLLSTAGLVGCAEVTPPEPTPEADGDAALAREHDRVTEAQAALEKQPIRRRPIGDRPFRDDPPKKPEKAPDGTQELTAGECIHFKGEITHDPSCPSTSSETGSGGKLVGTFKCTIGGVSLCIDESVAQ